MKEKCKEGGKTEVEKTEGSYKRRNNKRREYKKVSLRENLKKETNI